MAKSDADAMVIVKLTSLCLCFGLLAIFYWRLARIIAVDYAVLGGWRRNFVKCVVFPHFQQACVVAYLTLEMRSDYAKCVVVGRSARASTCHHTLNGNHWNRLLEIPAIIGVPSNITTFNYICRFFVPVNMFYCGRNRKIEFKHADMKGVR